MLDDTRLYELTEEIIDTVREIEMELLISIAKRIDVNDSIGGTAQWQIKQLQEMGLLHEESIRIISRYSNKTVDEVKRLIEKASIESINIGSLIDVYDLGLTKVNPLSVNITPIINTYQQALEKESRLILTNAITNANKQYYSMIDKVVLETTSGIKSYNQSITDSLDELSRKGITATQYQGIDKNGEPYVIDYPIEASIRRTVMTSINQVANVTNQEYIKVLEPPQIAVSQHLGARDKGIGHTNHQSWQGKAYDNDGTFEKITGYGNPDMLGLGGYNCRHIQRAHYPGVSPDIEEPIDSKENNKQYELLQKQRSYERSVREAKRMLEVAKVGGDKEHIGKVKKLRDKRIAKLDSFTKENNLRRDHNRENIAKSFGDKEPLNKPFNDVTNEWISNLDSSKQVEIKHSQSYVKDGVEYGGNQYKLIYDADAEEINHAKWLSETFKEDVYIVPRTGTKGNSQLKAIPTPDYFFKEEYWDLKQINGSGKNTIRDRVRSGEDQASNFLISITEKSKLTETEVINQVRGLYKHKNTSFVEKVILKKGDDLLAVYIRKR